MSEWDRLHAVEERLGRVEGDIKVISQRLTPVEEGVANFRQFQTRGNRYFDRAEAVLDANEKRRNDSRFWVGILALFLVPLFGWMAFRAYVFTEDVIQMDHDWHMAQHDPSHRNSWYLAPMPSLQLKIQKDAKIPLNP